jgi:hypothetical protein
MAQEQSYPAIWEVPDDRKPSVSRFDALQDVKPAHRRLTFGPTEVISKPPCRQTLQY